VLLIGPDCHGRMQACLWALQVLVIHLSLSKENAQLDFGQDGSLRLSHPLSDNIDWTKPLRGREQHRREEDGR
jgi:hypothetical protein